MEYVVLFKKFQPIGSVFLFYVSNLSGMGGFPWIKTGVLKKRLMMINDEIIDDEINDEIIDDEINDEIIDDDKWWDKWMTINDN